MTSNTTWRDDPGIVYFPEYRKKFAWLPVRCQGESKKVWWRNYYAHYQNWTDSYSLKSKDQEYHPIFIGNITEDEYMVRKLAETL